MPNYGGTSIHMSTQSLINAIKGRHQPHAANPSIDCDACRLLRILDVQRDAFDRIQELVSKSQWDAAAFTAVIKTGRGPEAGAVHPGPTEEAQPAVDAPAQPSPPPAIARGPAGP